MQKLETERLYLLPFSLELKRATRKERTKLPEMLGVTIPASWPGTDVAEALPFFIEATEKDPEHRIWDGIIIHKADQVAIGGIGFHGAPDEMGMVEIGYNIIPEYEGQGYATEMARCVIAWALRTRGITRITAECFDTNVGSIRVLEKIGMHRLEPAGNMLRWEISQEESTF